MNASLHRSAWGDDFAGRVALVTGGASGIGAAVVERLAAAGATVIAADIDLPGATALCESLAAAGGRCSACEVDVTQPASMDAVVADAVRRHGALHLAVNNAGVSGSRAPLAEQTLESWHRVIDHNLHGVFHAMKSQIPAMLSAGGGAIVNLASVLSQVGSPLAPAYTAAKHAVVGLTRSAALAYATQGLRINAIAPGYVDTPLLGHLGPQALAEVAALHPMQRLGTAAEVADAILFLLSPRAAFMTGTVLMADGGYTAR